MEAGTGDYARMDWRPQGEHIGWLDGDDIYLQADSAFAAVQKLARDAGEKLPVNSATKKKRLHERGMLASTERYSSKGREVDGLEIRKVVQGKRRPVLHFNSKSWTHTLSGSEPSEPSEPRMANLNSAEQENGPPIGSQTGDQAADMSHGSEPSEVAAVPGEGSNAIHGSNGSQIKQDNLPPVEKASRSIHWGGGTISAEEPLRQARSQGASFELMKSGRIKVLADSPLSETLMAELRQHKDDIRILLVQVLGYQVTACVCCVPKGPTGSVSCGV